MGMGGIMHNTVISNRSRDLPQEPPIRHLSSGEVLFHEGDAAHNVFLVQSGCVEMYQSDGMVANVLQIAGAGTVLGKQCALDGRPRFASARASGPTSVLVMHKQVFDDEGEDEQPFSRDIVEALKEYVRQFTARTNNR